MPPITYLKIRFLYQTFDLRTYLVINISMTSRHLHKCTYCLRKNANKLHAPTNMKRAFVTNERHNQQLGDAAQQLLVLVAIVNSEDSGELAQTQRSSGHLLLIHIKRTQEGHTIFTYNPIMLRKLVTQPNYCNCGNKIYIN